MLGTSPFLGAGQFGSRASQYYQHFYLHPENTARLIVEAADLGITCVQAIAYEPIVKAILEARTHTTKDIQIAPTVGAEDFDSELEVMKNLGAKIIFTHGRITDRLDRHFNDCIDKIDEIAIAGAVTHNPGVVIPSLSHYHKVKIIMAPINLAGRFMVPSPESALEAINNTEKLVIGKKTLAAGLLEPREALEYVAEFVYGVTIGIASSEELKETFGIAREIWEVTGET